MLLEEPNQENPRSIKASGAKKIQLKRNQQIQMETRQS